MKTTTRSNIYLPIGGEIQVAAIICRSPPEAVTSSPTIPYS